MQRYIFFWKHSDWRKGGKSCGSDERIAENAYFLNVTCCMLHVTATFSAYTHIYMYKKKKKHILCKPRLQHPRKRHTASTLTGKRSAEKSSGYETL